MTAAGYWQGTHEHLPEEQRSALRSAVRWQIFTIAYTTCTITIIAFVMGDSQAMRTAWFEDMLSLLPQVSFLVALPFVRRRPSRDHPYGWHRAMGIGHLLAGAALLGVGLHLAIDSAGGLIDGIFTGERTRIGDVEIFGHTIWQGWIMVGVMAVIVIGPIWLYGPAKARIAPVLHSKLLYADADMAKADWQTTVASIVGVLGIGAGIWWLDGAAAIFIAVGIVRDGVSNCSAAVQDLMDRRARSYDGSRPHPLGGMILAYLRRQSWIAEAGIRVRDQGQVFHVEVFVRPLASEVSLERLAEVSEGVADLDWKIQDVVVVPADPIPDYADRLNDSESGS
ncbi:cation transporter [Leucobacter chironomi]|uniref:cation transporter n=1 Tax=Leucobacter chironomi TaxID=491918 RepID=UPI000422515E|nr:cation transporter [Leucobacter chironomi]